MNVSATGIPVTRLKSRREVEAPTRATPFPASTTGWSAERMIRAASSSSVALGSGRRKPLRTFSGSASSGAPMTSSGSSR